MSRLWWLAMGVAVLVSWGCHGRHGPTDPGGDSDNPVSAGDGGGDGDGGVLTPDAGTELDGGTVTPTCPPTCPGNPGSFSRRPAANPIPAENQRPGNPDWFAGRPANAGQVELYASIESAEVGDVLGVKVSTDADVQVRAELYRLGDYGGAGARLMWQGGPFPAHRQPECPRDPSTGRVECAWSDTFSVTVGEDWVSGVYLVKVIRPEGFRRFTTFVVRDHRAAEILLQPGLNTAQAYNTWGGESLYEDDSGTLPSGRAFEVSFDRPYREDDGTGQVLRWEFPLIQFLERNGYDVTYGTGLDFARFDTFLDGIGALVIGGHDEYWTEAERDQVEAALASGNTSLVHLGGNGGYWRVRALSDRAGTSFRGIACYKNDSPTLDPERNSTVRFRDPPNEKPEGLLFGAMYDSWELVPFPLIVKDPNHWLFEGTGLKAGERLVGLAGYEFDRVTAGLAPPGISISMESPIVTAEGLPSVTHVVDRTLPSGRLVFSAGVIYWPLGLSADPEVHDGRVERMTLNVLERALSHRHTPRSLPPATGPVPHPPAPIGNWAASVRAYAGTAGAPGWVDGPASSARFQGPTGLALTPDGRLVVADTGNNRIRLIDSGGAHAVSTIAGDGQLGARDGPGNQAQFRSPTGVAVGPDGSIYVADSDNHVIRRIANDPPRWTVSLYAGAFRQQGFADGAAPAARFHRPTALAIDEAGNLYVADQAGNRIRYIDAVTRQVTTIAGTGSTAYGDAARGTQARFNNPSALALGPDGDLYVVDAGNQKIRRISDEPVHPVTTIAGDNDHSFGFADGNGKQARFRAQMGLAVTPTGEVLVADTANFRIRKLLPGATSDKTQVTTLAGSGEIGTQLGRGDAADLVAPSGLVVAPDGTVYVSDSYNAVIRAIKR